MGASEENMAWHKGAGKEASTDVVSGQKDTTERCKSGQLCWMVCSIIRGFANVAFLVWCHVMGRTPVEETGEGTGTFVGRREGGARLLDSALGFAQPWLTLASHSCEKAGFRVLYEGVCLACATSGPQWSHQLEDELEPKTRHWPKLEPRVRLS